MEVVLTLRVARARSVKEGMVFLHRDVAWFSISGFVVRFSFSHTFILESLPQWVVGVGFAWF